MLRDPPPRVPSVLSVAHEPGPPRRGRASPASPGGARGRVAWALLFALAAVALARGVATTALVDPDEGRTAEVAREMWASGDWTVPHLNGLPYLDKPVALFAAVALSIGALGPSELAARLPSLAAAVATAALLVAFARRRLGDDAAAAAGLALATSPLVVAFARIAIFDSPLMLCVCASCLAFWIAWERDSRAWLALGWAAAGLASLTKGPVGLLLPLLANLGFALVCRRPLRRLFHPLGLGAYALVVAPWFLAVTLRHPEFPHYAFVRETFERVATGRLRRTGPWWYFAPLLVGGTLPWVLAPVAGWRRIARAFSARRGDGALTIYLLTWVALPTLFFSLSQSKRPGYILPVFPAVALLAADALCGLGAAGRRRLAGALAALCALAAAAAWLGAGTLAGQLTGVPGLAQEIPHAGLALGIGLALAAAAALAGARHGGTHAVAAALALVPVSAALAAQGALDAVAQERSARAVAAAIAAQAPTGFGVVAIGVYPPSLAYYLERPLRLASADARELGSNYIADYVSEMRELPGSTLLPADGWRAVLRACAAPTYFVLPGYDLFGRDELERGLPLVAEASGLAAYGPCAREAR
jgi:4-amino-4-deoxy-L-arabinose transferase-like glycosyltransferase